MSEKSGKKTNEQLLKALRDRIDPSERDMLLKRMSTDDDFRATLEALAEMSHQYGDALPEGAFPAALDLAKGIVDAAIGKHGKQKENRGIIIYDSRLLPTPAGVREAAVEHRRVRVATNQGDLLISIYPETPKTYRVMGKLSNDVEATEIVVQLRDTAKTIESVCSERGIFEFHGVRCGCKKIAVRIGRKIITDFELEI